MSSSLLLDFYRFGSKSSSFPSIINRRKKGPSSFTSVILLRMAGLFLCLGVMNLNIWAQDSVKKATAPEKTPDTKSTDKEKESPSAATPPKETPDPKVTTPPPTSTATSPVATVSAPVPATQVPSTTHYNGNHYTPYHNNTNDGYPSSTHQQDKRDFLIRAFADTVKPYVADASRLPIVRWNENEVEAIKSLTPVDTVVKAKTQNLNTNLVANLDAWRVETRVFSVPFQIEGVNNLSLSRYFDLPVGLRDSLDKLYLYFEGISWRAEIKINGKYLGIHEDPFQPFLLPLNTKWLRDDDNLIEVTLSNGKVKPFLPDYFLGIFRPAYILTDAQLKKIQSSPLKAVATTREKVAILTPYYNTHKYIFNRFEAIRTLTHAQHKGIQHVYFLLDPDRNLRQLCAEMGFIEVQKLEADQLVAWINRYPYRSTDFAYSDLFWVDESQHRTPQYAQVYPYNASKVWANSKSFNPFQVFWLLIPLFGLFFVKLINPNFYYSLTDILVKPKLQLEKFMEITYGNQGLLTLLLLVRVLIVATTLALFISYIHTHHQWEFIERLDETSLIQVLFPSATGFFSYLWKSILLVFVWTFFKGAILRTLSRLYKIFNMYEGMTNLELLGSYPLLFLLPVPLLFLWVATPAWHTPLLFLQLIFVGVYVGRQVYVCFVGMDRLFRFSLSVKLLYILLAVIFPYILCL